MKKHLITLTLSLLFFFSVSFLTVMKSVFLSKDNYELEIGFPFIYYKSFFISDGLCFSWFTDKLLIDFLIFVIITFLIRKIATR